MSSDEIARFRANKIGIVYRSDYWVKSFNVLENVAMPFYFLGYKRAKVAKIAMMSLERVGMQDYAKKYPAAIRWRAAAYRTCTSTRK